MDRGLTHSRAAGAHTNDYLAGPLLAELGDVSGKTLLDIGCGTGVLTAIAAARGAATVGIDVSESGLAHARASYPALEWASLSAYDDLRGRLGRDFDVVISMEAIEHLYDPRLFLKQAHRALKPGGLLVLSTPYHGYLKNLVLALSGRLDAHFTALWDGGHIKFFSWQTLGRALDEAGFVDLRFRGAGRLPGLWKSMVVSARRP